MLFTALAPQASVSAISPRRHIGLRTFVSGILFPDWGNYHLTGVARRRVPLCSQPVYSGTTHYSIPIRDCCAYAVARFTPPLRGLVSVAVTYLAVGRCYLLGFVQQSRLSSP